MRRGSLRRVAAAAIVAATGLVALPHGAAISTSSGEGFDVCEALPSSTMRSVTGFPVANIYIGRSDNLACPQLQLNAGWVSTVTSAGWRLLPTFIGKQAPCTTSSKTALINPSTAATDGSSDADLAASRMQELGLGAPNVVYDDMESYDQTNASCSAAVAAYLDAFIGRLHSDGFRVGVYGSRASTIAQLVAAYNNGARQRPDDIWVANPDGNDTTADASVPAGDWVHRRVRQYQFDATLAPPNTNPSSVNIDKDAVDGDTAAPSADALPPYAVSGTTTYRSMTPGHVNERGDPSTANQVVKTDAEGAQLDITCQTTGETVAGDSVWDQLADGNYVSDLFTTTPGGRGFAGTLPRCDNAPTARIIAPLDGTQVDEHGTITAQVDVPIAATSVHVDMSSNGGSTWQSVGTTTTFANGVATLSFTAPGVDGTAVKLRATVSDSATMTSWPAINSPSVHVVAPRVTMAAAPAGTTAASYTFAWTGLDGAARPTAYDWQYQSAPWNGGFGAWSSPVHTTATSKAVTLAAGYEYCVRVRAYGLFGNVGDWSAPRCTGRLLDDRAMSAGAGWTRGTARGYYFGTYSSSKTAGAGLVRTGTTVNRVGILATTCPTCGSVYVYVGNTLVATWSLYATSTHLQQLLTTRAFTVRSKVTVTVRVHSSGKLVQIDGLLLRRNG